MSALPTYPAYKPAAVPWLQQVPEHWELLRTKNFLREVNVRSKTGKEDLLSVSQYTGITRRKDSMRGGSGLVTTAKTLVGYKLVEPGDLVMNIMLAWRGSQAVSPIAGITSPAYSVFRVTSDQVVPQYLHYIYRTELYNGLFKTVSTGVMDSRLRLYPEVFFRLPTLLPPPDEQHLIVRYLHALDAKVKRYIRTKRNLIARLQEQKQAIIQRAVTRGLDPKVKLKPSGVEWLGDVPVHWEVRSNRSMLRIKKSVVGDMSKDYTLLSLTLRGVIARDMENPEGKFPAEFNTYQVVVPGDLVFCLFDVDETPRTVGLSSLHGMITGAYTVFGCVDQTIARFLYYFYLAMDEQKQLKPFYTGLRKVVQKATFQSIKLAVPPKDEIGPILSYVDKEAGEIDRAIGRIENEIKLMNEYHTRMVADVVTGAVDVTAAAKAMAVETTEVMEEEPLSMAAEGEAEYGESEE